MNTRTTLFALVTLGAVAVAPGCAQDSGAEDDDDFEASADAITATSSLEEVVRFLGHGVKTRAPGAELAITVRDLETDELVQHNGDVKHTSASSAKAIWVAAALFYNDDSK